jgi:catechol 2,3-dioxygenase-like lactoylglutathione lyase family enzyme
LHVTPHAPAAAGSILIATELGKPIIPLAGLILGHAAVVFAGDGSTGSTQDPNRTSSFLNIRVSDIQAVYEEWSARDAELLTPPKQHQAEFRCYIRDPDGHLIEVSQTALPGGWNQFLNQS